MWQTKLTVHLIGSSWKSDSVLLLSKSLLLRIHGRNRRFDVEASSGLAPPLELALLMLIVLLLLLKLLTLLVSEFLLLPYTATLPSFSARSSSCFRSRTSWYADASKLFRWSRIACVGGLLVVLGFSLNEAALSMSERAFIMSTSSTFT
jgi:hypothetical protein